jgi:hypothetical protein
MRICWRGAGPASNSAIGVYSGADLATLAEPSFDVLLYAFGRLLCVLRRHHPL